MKKIRYAVRYIDSCNPPVIRSGGVWYKGIRPVLKSRMDKVGKAELIRLMLRQWIFSPEYEKDGEKGDICAGILFEWTAAVCRESWKVRRHDLEEVRGHWMYACE